MGRTVTKLIYRCRDGYVFTMLGGGGQAGIVTSSKALVEMANRDGYLLDLADFDWSTYDFAPVAMAKAFGMETEGTKLIDHFVEELEKFLPTKSKQELFDEAVQKAILLIPVCDTKDVVESPQLAARDFWVQVTHPEFEKSFTYPGFPIKGIGLPPYNPQRRAPLIGEHNEEIYCGELGLSKQEMTLLKATGTI